MMVSHHRQFHSLLICIQPSELNLHIESVMRTLCKSSINTLLILLWLLSNKPILFKQMQSPRRNMRVDIFNRYTWPPGFQVFVYLLWACIMVNSSSLHPPFRLQWRYICHVLFLVFGVTFTVNFVRFFVLLLTIESYCVTIISLWHYQTTLTFPNLLSLITTTTMS